MDQKERERFEAFKELHEKSFDLDQKIRSRIIFNAIMVENEVERIIATHFCREESQEQLFISLLFSGGFIPFSQKTIIFK